MSETIPPIVRPPPQLVDVLTPGEVVLWSGIPRAGSYAKQMQQLWGPDSSCLSRIAMCALALVLLAPLLWANHAISTLPAPFNWVIAIVGVLAVVGLGVLIWQLGVRYLATERAATTIYAITDKRVIESHPGETRSYRPGNLAFLTIRAGSDDLGDVLFTLEPVVVDESPPDEVEHGFIGVEHPYNVAAILRAAFPRAPFAEPSRPPESNS